MNSSDLYISLTSRASSSFFKNNPSNYKVHLAQPLSLDGKWEAALTEITYEKTWKSLSGDCRIRLYYGPANKLKESEWAKDTLDGGADEPQESDGKGQMVKFKLSAGNYKSTADMINEIANKARSKGAEFRLYYDLYGRKVRIEGPTVLFIENNAQLISALGKPKTDVYELLEKDGVKFQPYACPYVGTECVLQTIPTLYVYGDFVEYSRVGDAIVPWLRTVPATGEPYQTVNHTFLRPYYLPVSKGYINSMEIHIASSTGEDIPFESGEVNCTIHLRKCAPAL